MRKFIATTISDYLNENVEVDSIKYFGKLTPKEHEWLIITGRRSYSGGELRPIFYNNIMIGGISWNLGGIDYLQFIPKYKNKGFLKYIVYDNAENNIVKFVSASDELKEKLSNYGHVYYDENDDITTVVLNKTKDYKHEI